MSKSKSFYVCQHCGAHFGKWSGQCSDCGEWNSLIEAPNVSRPHHNKTNARTAHNNQQNNKHSNKGNYAGVQSGIIALNAVSVTMDTRLPTGIGEFDRVLGGGLVAGSVVLIFPSRAPPC